VIRYKVINGTQYIEEICEHCGEKVTDVHVTEIIAKPEWQTDMVFTMKDAADADYVVKTQDERSKEVQIERMAEGMITASGATTESLKYKLRSERMCSSSTNTNEEFCYRTTNVRFLDKYEAEWDAAGRVQTGSAGGLKVGIGRTGTVLRIKSESLSDATKYHGPWKQSWFRDLSDDEKQARIDEEVLQTDLYIEDSATAEDWQTEIGD